jgi:hypothetical protein
MRLFDRLDRHPTTRTLLGFGLVMFVAGAAAAAVLHLLLGRSQLALAAVGVGTGLLLVAPVWPISRRLYIVWMAFALTLRAVLSPIVLAAVFLLVFTPIGLLRRAFGSDPLRLRPQPNASTFWEDRPEPDDIASHLRQY